MRIKFLPGKAFTLVELLIVIIIISIIAGFGIPGYTKTIGRARARDAISNLSIIHASNVIFRIRTGGNVLEDNLGDINTALNLNVISSGGTVYECSSNNCTATSSDWDAGTQEGFQVTADLAAALGGNNPDCAGSRCP